MKNLSIGMVLFGGVTQLDLTGPYEVLSRMSDATIHLIASTTAPVKTEWGMRIIPDYAFDDAPPCDILVVPGGWGVNAQLDNAQMIGFLRERGSQAQYVTSVCSGALLLGAADLLRGYRATTHWMSLDLLKHFGAEAIAQRVVRDRNRITGGGVTAGIDFGLALVAELRGEDEARRIQLAIEYDPAPPFDSGSPRSASPSIVDAVKAASAEAVSRRRAIIQRLAEGASGMLDQGAAP